MFSSILPENRIQRGTLFLLPALAVFSGGKEIVGLALYHAVSLILFCQTLGKYKFVKTPLDKPLAVFLLVAGLSTLHSMTVHFRGFIHFLTLLIHCLNFYVFVKITDDEFVKLFLKTLVFVCVVLSVPVILIFQFFPEVPRITLLTNANLLSCFLACGTITILCKTIWEKKNRPTMLRFFKGAISYSIIIALLMSLFFLFSRGALAALAGGMAVLLILNSKKILTPVIACVIVILILTILYPRIMSNIVTKLRTLPENTRAVVWQGALQAFVKKPILGWGIASFGQVYPLYKLPMESEVGQYEKTTRFAHNEFLQVLVEMGSVGFAAYGTLLFLLLKEWVRFARNRSADNWTKFSVAACMAAILIHSLFDFTFHLSILAYLFIFFSAYIIKTNLKNSLEAGLSNGFWGFLVLKMKAVRWAAAIWVGVSLIVISSGCFAKLAETKKETGLKSEAVRYYKIAAALNPFYFENLKQLAMLSGPAEREALLKKAVRYNPGNDELYILLGRSYLHQGRIEKAIRETINAINRNPKNSFYYGEAGELYLHKNDLGSALAFYKKAVEVEPLYVWGHFRLSKLFLALGDNTKAEAMLKNIRAIQKMNLRPESDYARRLIDFDAIPPMELRPAH